MKKTTIKNIPLLLMCSLIFFFNACKKQDVKSGTTITQSEKETLENARNYILTHSEGNMTTRVVNEPATNVYFSDANNNHIDVRQYLQNIQNNPMAYTAVCTSQYDGNGDPVDNMFPSNFVLNSTGFIYDCGNSGQSYYKVSFKWSLAVHHLLQESNSYTGPTLRSRYNLKIKNSAGAVIATYNSNFISGADIRDQGDWAIDPTRKLYDIYASISIPSGTFNSGVTYETTITLETNCIALPQISATHTTTSVSSLNSQPCVRTDRVWVTPGTGSGGIANALGTFNVCSIPGGYTTAGTHELQYRKQNVTTSDSWDAQTSALGVSTVLGSSLTPLTPPFIFSTSTGVLDLDGMISGSGPWLVRYRNKGTCTTPGPWLVEKLTL